MEQPPLVIVGVSRFTDVYIDIVQKQQRYKLIGLLNLLDQNPDHTLDVDVPILGYEHSIIDLFSMHPTLHLFVAVSDNFYRCHVVKRLVAAVPCIRFATLIHPFSSIGLSVSIQEGSVLMAGAIVSSGSIVGKHCIINTKASVDYDCTLADFSSLAPGATLGANIIVGEFSEICIGSCIDQNKSIGSHSVIGAGSVVRHDIQPFSLVDGVAARDISIYNRKDKYFLATCGNLI